MRLIELMESDGERVALMAADKVYERAWGKPRDYDPKDGPDPNRPKFDPRLLTPEQLDFMERALRLILQATRAPSDTFDVEVKRCFAGRRTRAEA